MRKLNLVVGATGTVGGEICRLLASNNQSVRALTRASSSPQRIHALSSLGAEIVVGDLKDKRSLVAACQGVSTIYSSASGLSSVHAGDDIESVDRIGQRQLIDVAQQEGVEKFVYISVLDLKDNFAFANAKHHVEEYLQAARIDHVILQPTCFMDEWLSPASGFDYVNGHATIYGDGNQKLGWIHSADVARCAVVAAHSVNSRNTTIPLVGPDKVSPLDVVAIFESLTGKPLAVDCVPIELLEQQHAQADNPTDQSVAGLMLHYATGDSEKVSSMTPIPDMEFKSVEQFVQETMA